MPKLSQFQVQYQLFVANIKSTYYAATQYPTIHDAGLNWYTSANQEASLIAQRNRVSLEATIGIIAALSPHNSWERSLLDTEVLIKAVTKGKESHQFKVSTFNPNKEKGIMIAQGTSPLDALNGNKTKAFFKNILNPQDAHIVTIDGHAYHVAIGKFAALAEAKALSDKAYEIFANAYRQACHEINLDTREEEVLPCQVQAVTWQYYRILKGIDKSFVID